MKRSGAISAISVSLVFGGVLLKQNGNVVMSGNTGIPKDTDATEYASFDKGNVEYFKKFEKLVANSMTTEQK